MALRRQRPNAPITMATACMPPWADLPRLSRVTHLRRMRRGAPAAMVATAGLALLAAPFCAVALPMAQLNSSSHRALSEAGSCGINIDGFLYTGLDILVDPSVASPAACRELCRNTKGCVKWSLQETVTNKPGCHVKSTVGNGQMGAGSVTSGDVVGHSNDSPIQVRPLAISRR